MVDRRQAENTGRVEPDIVEGRIVNIVVQEDIAAVVEEGYSKLVELELVLELELGKQRKQTHSNTGRADMTKRSMEEGVTVDRQEGSKVVLKLLHSVKQGREWKKQAVEH